MSIETQGIDGKPVRIRGSMQPMRRLAAVLLASLLGSLSGCALPEAIEALEDRSPPPEFGRPAWVRTCAGVGAWVGGIAGGAVSIVLLPVTWPLSKVASDGLGEHAASEFVLFPALGCASVGHAVLGTPPDLLDYVFRRMWRDASPPVSDYEVVAMPGVKVAGAGH